MGPLYISPLAEVAKPGRWGNLAKGAGVTVREIRKAGLATVTAHNGKSAALAQLAQTHFNVELPSRPHLAQGPTTAFIGTGPGRWLAFMPERPAAGMEALLAPLSANAAIVDQSDGFTLLRLTGSKVRDALAKGVAIDLHPTAFAVGDAAVTLVAHITVQFWQVDAAPTYAFAIARGWTGSFWEWLEASAAEYGLELAASPGA